MIIWSFYNFKLTRRFIDTLRITKTNSNLPWSQFCRFFFLIIYTYFVYSNRFHGNFRSSSHHCRTIGTWKIETIKLGATLKKTRIICNLTIVIKNIERTCILHIWLNFNYYLLSGSFKYSAGTSYYTEFNNIWMKYILIWYELHTTSLRVIISNPTNSHQKYFCALRAGRMIWNW